MTNQQIKPLAPGDQFHFLRSGIIFRTSSEAFGGEVSARAQTVTVTASLLEASQDINGNSWLDLVDDEAAQTARWGEPAFTRGPAPADLTHWQPGTEEQTVARATALAAAWALPEGDERNSALRDVVRTYGRALTSSTMNTTPTSR
jgi:hypothetical protein